MNLIVNLVTQFDPRPIDNYLAYAEKQCRAPLYVTGYFTGHLYAFVFGKVLIVAGAAFAALNLFLYAISTDAISTKKKTKLLDNARDGEGYVVHGIANVIVGEIAAIPIVGSFMILPAYDNWVGRFHYYPGEIPPAGVESLNPYYRKDSEIHA